MTRTTDPWGDPIKPTAENRPVTHRFRPIPKIEAIRARDPWGAPVKKPHGLSREDFDTAVRAAQDAIFEKARPTRESDEAAIRYVDAVTTVCRHGVETDREFIAALQRSGARSVEEHRPIKRPQQRQEARRGPFGTVARPGPGGRTIHVREEGTTR